MSFRPILFGDFNKNVDDLNETSVASKFDFSNSVTIKRNTGLGLSVSTTATLADDVSGEVEAVYKSSDFGKLTVNQQTSGAMFIKAKLTKLVDNLTANVEAYDNVEYVNGGKMTLKTSAQFLQDNFTVDGGLSVINNGEGKYGSSLYLKASAGMDGFSVGGSVVLDPQGENKVSAYDAGIRYEQDNVNFNVQTAKTGSKIKAGYYHRVNSSNSVGLLGVFDRENNTRTLTVVNDYDIDANTCTKVSLDTTGVARVALEHSLADPRVRVNVAQSFNFAGGSKFTADKFGLGLTFGDY